MPELTLNISPPPPPTLVLDISPPQGPEGPQGNTGPQGDTGPVGPTGPQPDLSTDTPEDLGTAAAGVSTDASRSDHVHAMPSAADVGADPAGAANAVAGDLSTHESLTTSAHGGIVGDTDARLTDARTPLAHTHGQSDVTGLVADMAAKQPLDSDLTAIAALSTTAFGRSLLEVVDAVGGRAALSAAAATHVHSGADITSGTVAPARLGSGTPDASKVLRGDGTWGPNAWPPPPPHRRINYDRYGHPSQSENYSPGLSLGESVAVPAWLPVGPITAVDVVCHLTGDRQYRLFIYPASETTGLPDGQPLMVDAGTFTPSATGAISLPVTYTVTASGPFTVWRPAWLFCGATQLNTTPGTLWGYGINAGVLPLWNGAPQVSAYYKSRGASRRLAVGAALASGAPAVCGTTSQEFSAFDVRVKI